MTRSKGVLVAGLVVLALVGGGVALRMATASDGGSAPVDRLDCPTKFAKGIIDSSDRQSFSGPEELAEQAARGLKFEETFGPLEQRLTYQDDKRAQVAFVDRGSRTVAVIDFRHHDEFGWRISTITRCGG